MKKGMLYLTIISLILLFGCGGNQRVKKKDYNSIKSIKEIESIKKILIFPLYTDSKIIPGYNRELKTISFSPLYRKKFYNHINGLAPDIQKMVVHIFKNGRYNLEVKEPKESIKPYVFTEIENFKIKGNPWPYNYKYNISSAVIKNICRKYTVDSLLFHYFQVKKVNHTFYLSNSELTLPIYKLTYRVLIYNKDGEVIYTRTRDDVLPMETYALLGDNNRVEIFTPEKIDLSEVISKIDMKLVNRLFHGTREGNGVYLDFMSYYERAFKY